MRRTLLVGLCLLAGCPGTKPSGGGKAPPVGSHAAAKEASSMIATDAPGLTFKLGEGVEGAAARAPIAPAKTTPLDAAAAARILARLAPLKTQADDEKAHEVNSYVR
jgi:hypothetical protein